MWRKGDPGILLVGMLIGLPSWETVWRFKKTKNRTTIWSSDSTPLHVSRKKKKKNTNWKRYMYPNVHNSTIYNNQNTGAPQVTINRQMGQDTHTHSQWNIAAKLLQSCPTLCNPIDGSPPGSPVPGILQARTLEWVAISFSNGWKWKVKVKSLSRVQPSVTPWTAAFQAPPSMRFSRQEYWSGVPLPSRKPKLKKTHVSHWSTIYSS